MIRKLLTPEEFARAKELFAIAFEQPMKRSELPEPEEPGVHRWGVFDDASGELTGSLIVTDFTVQFDGRPCKMGGIGGVASLPQFRRRGGIRRCFEAMLPDLYTNEYDFSYLYPFSTAYYRKFGYECCVQKLSAAVDLSLLNPPRTTGTLRLAEPASPMTEAIRAVDAVWEDKFNMMVLHQDKDYQWAQNQDPAVKQEFTYVYFAAGGTPKAYTTFTRQDQPDGRNLVCSRFFFTDREGFAGLMGLFKSLSADHRLVKFAIPAQSAMQYLMPEWSTEAVAWSIQPAGMVRVINVENVLRKAKYAGEGSVVLQITDPQIEPNNRTYAVRFYAGQAVHVDETRADPNAILSISTFSALISGVCDFADAANLLDGLEVCRPSAALSQVFHRKPLMIADHF